MAKRCSELCGAATRRGSETIVEVNKIDAGQLHIIRYSTYREGSIGSGAGDRGGNLMSPRVPA